MAYSGTILKFGRDIDTDVIIAARYLNSIDMKELAKHCMEDLDPSFVGRAKPGDIIVAEENFGCGSSREHAPLVIKELGISCIIAKSFARIFYRNSINVGLPILVCPEAVDASKENGEISVDLTDGRIMIGEKTFQAQPFPPFLQEMIQVGGLMPYTRKKLDSGKK